MEVIQIALVDDHRLFRSGIAALINGFHKYQILFEAGDGDELIGKLKPRLRPDIILLDINMPNKDGLATATWLRTKHPEISVIVVSMVNDDEKVLQMVRLGVKGYLLKDAEPEEFVQALSIVSRGDMYFPQFVTRLLTHSVTFPDEETKLSEREIEFLKLVSSDLTYKQIAQKLKVSARTVDGYRDNLFNKLNVKTRVGLVLYAVKNNYIQF